MTTEELDNLAADATRYNAAKAATDIADQTSRGPTGAEESRLGDATFVLASHAADALPELLRLARIGLNVLEERGES